MLIEDYPNSPIPCMSLYIILPNASPPPLVTHSIIHTAGTSDRFCRPDDAHLDQKKKQVYTYPPTNAMHRPHVSRYPGHQAASSALRLDLLLPNLTCPCQSPNPGMYVCSQPQLSPCPPQRAAHQFTSSSSSRPPSPASLPPRAPASSRAPSSPPSSSSTCAS